VVWNARRNLSLPIKIGGSETILQNSRYESKSPGLNLPNLEFFGGLHLQSQLLPSRAFLGCMGAPRLAGLGYNLRNSRLHGARDIGTFGSPTDNVLGTSPPVSSY
jgi:hypothetical protein